MDRTYGRMTPEKVEAFLKLIRLGNYSETAATAAGISPRTVRYWLRRGQAEQERLECTVGAAPQPDEVRYHEFYLRVTEANAQAESILVGFACKAAQEGNIKAVLEVLSRRFPRRWAVDVRRELDRYMATLTERLVPRVSPEVLEILTEVVAEVEAERDL